MRWPVTALRYRSRHLPSMSTPYDGAVGDLSSLFRPGASAGVQSNRVFTNRVDEMETFQAVLREFRNSPAFGAPGNLDHPRENVLNFFGMGGIGKTTLSKEIEARLHSTASAVPVATLRIDFEEAGSFDLESVVLRLRAAVGFLGIRLVAFDIGLAHYWERVHPGEELSGYIARSGRLQRMAHRVGISEHIGEAVKEVAAALETSSTIASVGTRSVQAIVAAVRRGRALRHAVEGCRFMRPLLEADVDTDYLSFLPALLAWDVNQGPPVTFVVFLDTYEKIDRQRVVVEKLLQRIVFLLPNVLFVVTGRNRLSWWDSRRTGELDYVGERIWPQLASCTRADARCRLIGDLSDHDAQQYLAERVTAGADAAIPVDVRERILNAAHGLPLYLDLAASHFVGVIGSGSPVSPDDFGDPFPALVARMMSDLDAGQRAVLRGVSLIGSFDRGLARAAGGAVRDGTVAALLTRSFVIDDSGKVLRYSLHPTLREALRGRVGIESDAWTEADWRDAALRLHHELGTRLEQDTPREIILEICYHGIALCNEFDIEIGWVGDAAETLYCIGLPVALERGDAFRAGSASEALARVMEIASVRGRVPVASSERQLSEIIHAGLLDQRTTAWVEVMRSDCRMDLGDYRGAEEGYRRILSGSASARIRSNASVSLRLLLSKAGRFREALDLNGQERFDDARIAAGIYLYNALWGEARDAWLAALRIATEQEHGGLQALCRTALAIVDGWTRAGDGERARVAARNAVEAGGGWCYPASLAAEALALVGVDSEAAARARRRSREEAQRLDLHDNVFDVLLAEAFEAAVSGDAARLARVEATLRAEVHRDGAHPQWIQVVSWWSGRSTVDPDIQWIDSAEAARQRWMDTVEQRRS